MFLHEAKFISNFPSLKHVVLVFYLCKQSMISLFIALQFKILDSSWKLMVFKSNDVSIVLVPNEPVSSFLCPLIRIKCGWYERI